MSIHHARLEDLVATPRLAAEIELEQIPELIGDLERLRATLWARLALRINRPPAAEDRLVPAADAASRLAVSKDWIYRHAEHLPFTVRLDGQLRFSVKGIDRYIASRLAGRGR
jgi:predicted DNA-binding transcriptional regulator AlpA